MRNARRCGADRRAEQGAATTEYALASVVVVATLLLPLPGLGDSLAGYLLMVLKQFQASSLFHLSLP